MISKTLLISFTSTDIQQASEEAEAWMNDEDNIFAIEILSMSTTAIEDYFIITLMYKLL